MTKTLISCGCSFSAKFDSEIDKPFGKLLSERSGYNHINLSRIGASNYLISKQIEYAASLNPDFITINSTTPLRFEYIISEIKQIPALKDFSYGKDACPPHTVFSGKILSLTYEYIKSYQNSDHKFIKKEKLDVIKKFLVEYTDYHVKKDQDRFMLLGAISKLIEKKIKFIVIDFSDILLTTDLNQKKLLNLNWDKMRNEFPHSDGLHFNQMGHNYIFEEILKIL